MRDPTAELTYYSAFWTWKPWLLPPGMARIAFSAGVRNHPMSEVVIRAVLVPGRLIS